MFPSVRLAETSTGKMLTSILFVRSYNAISYTSEGRPANTEMSTLKLLDVLWTIKPVIWEEALSSISTDIKSIKAK